MPTTLDPQEERERLDDLEQNFDAPSAPERKPVSADELEDLYNLPSADPIYDRRGTDPSDAPGKKNAPSKKDLRDAEQSPDADNDEQSDQDSSESHQQRVGAGYSPKGTIKSGGLLGSQLNKRYNKTYLIGGGGLLAVATLAIFFFIALAPLKIMHIVNNLQNRFYATSENAVSNEADTLFSNYLRTRVLPAARKCSGEVTKNCNPINGGSGLVAQLYRGWTNAKLEDKLATDYKIEFKYTKGHYYVKMPGMTGDGANLDGFVHPEQTQLFNFDDYLEKSNDPQFKKVSRKELRQSYKNALEGETKLKQVFYRYKVAGLLSRKYGLKRCIIACDTRDNFADWKSNKAKAAKLIIAERVISPRSEMAGLVVACIVAGDCDKTQTASDGQKKTAIESRLESKLAELEAEETGKYVDVLTHSNAILKDGYKKYLLKIVTAKLLGKELSDESANQMLKAVPVLGWINGAATTVKAVEKAPQEIRMASYVTNATAMIAMWGTYRVYADEFKTGNVDSAIFGSFNDTLGPGQSNDIGGSAQAEESPLYQNLIEGKTSATSANVKCSGGKSIPKGKLVCPEEVLGGDSSLVGSIQAITDSSWFKPIKTLADFWNSTAAKALRAVTSVTSGLFGFILEHTPGYSKLVDYIGNAVQPLLDAFVNYLIPSPFGNVRGADGAGSDKTAPSTSVTLLSKFIDPAYAASSDTDSGYMSGGRVFDLIAGGADAAGNDYAHNGLGGQALTPEQTATIVNEQLNANYQQYQQQPLLSRLFDSSSDYSLVSRMALAMPSTSGGMLRSIGSIFSNPFGKLGSVFGFITSPSHAFAAASVSSDPFGITQYGYPATDPTLAAANRDPEAYWNQNCSSDGTTLDWSKPVNAKWQDVGIKTDQTSPDGMPENTSTDPCLLIQAAVGSAGGLYDQSLLGQDQPGATSTVSSDNSSTSTATATIDMAHLYDDSTSVDCADGTNDIGVQDGYYQGNKVPIKLCAIPGLPSSGQESNGGFGVSGANGLAVVNSRVSGAVLAMVQAAAKDNVHLSANSSFRTMAHQQSLCPCDGVTVAHPGYSN
ncbi:MAG TPA: hypothetical protein VG964_03310, partial [Candidatus Saccharimonadales bacterium]|nr:hypothetical protein [Candidatus Saccharimonadales bacterium]